MEKNTVNYSYLDAAIAHLSGFTEPKTITAITVNGKSVKLNGPFLSVGSHITDSILDKQSATFDAVQGLILCNFSGFVLI